MTERRLDRIGVGRGWRCLEVGAGDGSVARALFERVGRHGHITATDVNLRFLPGCEGIEVREHDIASDELETNAYDLVHCRALLIHLREPKRALERMVAALRPGGWLLVEEPDIGSAGAANPDHPQASWFDRVRADAYETMCRLSRLDFTFGRRCPRLLEDVGLLDVASETTSWVCRGGDMGAKFEQMNLELMSGFWRAASLRDDDHDALSRLYDDPSFAFFHWAMVGAWGRRP